jgi:hypothetical protein
MVMAISIHLIDRQVDSIDKARQGREDKTRQTHMTRQYRYKQFAYRYIQFDTENEEKTTV